MATSIIRQHSHGSYSMHLYTFRHPVLIEGRLVADPEITIAKTNDILKRFSPVYGLQCRNEDQDNEHCHDYEVRYLCWKKR